MNDAPVQPERCRRARITMLFGTCAVALAAATAVLPGTAYAATSVCSNQTGSSNGSFYSFYTAGGSVCMTLG